jgi:formylglycine-generating enzyme required for sulfatase activity
VVDMSGNLKEWTATERPPDSGFFEIRGGAFNNVAGALTCDNDFLTFDEDIAFPTLGFRCCADGP